MTVRSLAVVLCTKDRSHDLIKCVYSLTQTTRPAVQLQVFLVDDGHLPPETIRDLDNTISTWGARFTYSRMLERHGLFNARVRAITEATADILLFLDDDVEVDASYLVGLIDRYGEWPSVSGIGGVDQLLPRQGRMARFFARTFFLDSGEPGALSISGFNGSLSRWRDASQPFFSEFLSGCNMSFRRSALMDVRPTGWLEGYSQGEDVYLSVLASKAGPLRVDPCLRVWHRRSGSSRAAPASVASMLIISLYRLLVVRHQPWTSYLALHWSVLGLAFRSIPRPGRLERVRGYLQGLLGVYRALLRG